MDRPDDDHRIDCACKPCFERKYAAAVRALGGGRQMSMDELRGLIDTALLDRAHRLGDAPLRWTVGL